MLLEDHYHSSVSGSARSTESAESKLDYTEIKIVLGAVDSSPIRPYEAGKILAGATLTAEKLEATAQLTAKLAKPMDNNDMNLGFRKKVVTRFEERALKEALEK